MKLVFGVVGAIALGILLVMGSMIATDPGDNVRLFQAGSRQDELGTRFVTGIIENFTSNTYAHVQFEIDFLDRDGNTVGTTVAAKKNLGAREAWDFEAAVLQEVAVEARLRGLACSKAGEEPHPRACFLPPTTISLVGQP
jgi:hypothetical protein